MRGLAVMAKGGGGERRVEKEEPVACPPGIGCTESGQCFSTGPHEACYEDQSP